MTDILDIIWTVLGFSLVGAIVFICTMATIEAIKDLRFWLFLRRQRRQEREGKA